MANPQTEKGYTRVANEILEQIMKASLNGTQYRIVLAIWRYTYGYRRKEYELSATFLAQLISASKGQVDRELKSLIDREIISVHGIGDKGARRMSFNKNYEEWKEPVKGNKPVTIPKNINSEKKSKKAAKSEKYGENNTYYKMAVYFHKRVTVVAQEAGVEHLIKKANIQSWSDDFRKLIELDGVSKHLAKDVMDWVTTDDFWKVNVLSAKKLREKFTDLAIKMNATKKPTSQKPKQVDSRDKDIEFQQWVAGGGDPNDFNWN